MCDWTMFDKAHLPKRKSKTFQAILRAGILCNQADFIHKKKLLEELHEKMPRAMDDWIEELETEGPPTDSALLKFYEKHCAFPSPSFDAYSEVFWIANLPPSLKFNEAFVTFFANRKDINGRAYSKLHWRKVR